MDDFDNEVTGTARIKREADKLIGGMGDHLSEHTVNRRCGAHFGATLQVIYFLWCLLDVTNDGPEGATIVHLLWSLMFLKMYGTIDTMARACGCDPNTFRKWTWLLIDRIHDLEGIVSN